MWRLLAIGLILTSVSFVHATPGKKGQAKVNRTAQKGQSNTRVKPVRLGCIVRRVPAQLLNDIAITNKGKTKIQRGSKIKWKTKGESGVVVLTKDLPPNKNVFFADVLKKGVEPGTECKARLKRKRGVKAPRSRPNNKLLKK